jgi:hypothetical protein
MSVLQGLDLSNNKITGDLPTAWGSLTNLQVGGRVGGWVGAVGCCWQCAYVHYPLKVPSI